MKKKIISNSFSIDLNDKENNNSQNNIKKESSNNSLLSSSNKKNPIRVKINNNILNSIKDIKDNNNKDKNDINRNIFNKKLFIANLSNKPIKEEKPKEEETDDGNDDDLLFFPKKSFKRVDKAANKIVPIQLKSLGEEFLISDEGGGGKGKESDKYKKVSPKFKKNKIYKMKGNENLKELILEDIQNKGELFSSLKVNSNYNQELFGVENIQKNSEPNEEIVNKEEANNANNINIKKEKKIDFVMMVLI